MNVLTAIVFALCTAAPAAPAKDKKQSDTPLTSVDALIATVPLELHGSDNAAKGPKFSLEKWNAWLKENATGKKMAFTLTFDGRVNAIDAEDLVLRRWAGKLYQAKESDAGGFHTSIMTPDHAVVFIFPANAKATLATLKEGEKIVITGTIRDAERIMKSGIVRDSNGNSRPVSTDTHLVGLENCAVKKVK